MSVNMKHVVFVVAWELSPSLEVAAALLGAKVRSVTRQANRMRAQGVQLKQLTDPRFDPHKETSKDDKLTEPQRAFMSEHYQFARRYAWKVCVGLDVARNKVEDLVEDAAVTALIMVARRSTGPDFVTATAKGLLATVVRRQLLQLLFAPSPKATQGPLEWSPSKRFPNPLEEAIRREEVARRAPQVARAEAIVGPLPHIQKCRNGGPNESLALRSKAHQLGLNARGSVEELRERIADHVRTELSQAPEVTETAKAQVPASIMQRFSQPVPSKSPQQQEAEKFVTVWETSATAGRVARTLGRTVRSVVGYAAYLRGLGVKLTRLPVSMRHVINITPSRN